MPRLAPYLLPFAFVGLLAACQFGSGGETTPGDVTPNAVAGDAIEVTPLDGGAPEATLDLPPGPQAESEKPAQSTAPVAEVEAAPFAEIEPAPKPELEEAPVEEQKSDKQIACEKQKGQWEQVGGASHTCIFNTKDAGKSCTKGTQCEGDCLARSGTCSPIRPLLGCNEILQDDGSRVTLCID